MNNGIMCTMCIEQWKHSMHKVYKNVDIMCTIVSIMM